jgi:peptidoglycan/LPS O-acetylase OafA/YrhL
MVKGATARLINGPASILLDCLRLGAALTVLFIHAFDKWFPTKAYRSSDPGEPSHAAVIIFFVLSGYVIAHTTISNNRGGMQYAQARLSRLSSVVLPAILITLLIQFLVGQINPDLYFNTRGSSWIRYLLSSLYLNELWLLSAAPPFNGSLWSLSFEFWYYTIFGIWFFRKQGWKSMALVVLACLIAGPKIMLMMPVWLCGYFAYRLPRPAVSRSMAWFSLILLLLCGYMAVKYLPAMPYAIHLKPLYYANQFFTDWIVGVFIGGALWILPNGNPSHQHTKTELWLRKVADLTFPLYVLHYPLLLLWHAVFGIHYNDVSQLWYALLTTITIAFLAGWFLEQWRQIWSAFFKKALIFVRSKFAAHSSASKTTVKS